MIRRAPRRELAPFIARLWASTTAPPTATRIVPEARELVLPTGAMHLVIRLDHPLRVFDAIDAAAPRTIGHAILGGARASAYVRDVSQPVCSVGAQLRPGAAELLLGVPASELAERHTQLDDLDPRFADELRARLADTRDPARRLDVLEAALLARLPRVRAIHPAVAHALGQFAIRGDVAAVVDEVGYSHRRFIAVFRHAVGLTPKLYCRVQRLQRALTAIAAPRAGSLADAAIDAGFSDQAHLNREFRELAGVSPGAYRALVEAPTSHVPVKR